MQVVLLQQNCVISVCVSLTVITVVMRIQEGQAMKEAIMKLRLITAIKWLGLMAHFIKGLES